VPPVEGVAYPKPLSAIAAAVMTAPPEPAVDECTLMVSAVTAAFCVPELAPEPPSREDAISAGASAGREAAAVER